MTTFDLNKHTARLLMNEPFFAALSRRINKSSSMVVPTAGVKVDKESGQFQMLYNPDFFEKLTDAERTDVLKHEFYHLVFEHVTGRMPEEGMSKLWNIATDLAINSHLPNLPEGCCMPGVAPFEELPSGKSAEWYFAELRKQQQENEDGEQGEGESGEGEGEQGEGSGQQGDGNGSGLGDMDSFDDHSGWGEVDQATKDIAKERLKDAVKKAAEEASKANNWGSVSSSVRRDIMERIATKVDWRKVLRYFIKTSQRSSKTSTVRRINKRFPYIHAGKRVNRTAKIAISIDQSGSVDDNMLNAFFNELNKLASLAEFTVIPFDSQVGEDKVYTWKKGQSKKWERVMYGGTCFNAPTKYVNERAFDGHIVLTDLMAPKPIASKCQRMWMTTKEYARRPYFTTNERIIAIDS
jgi:predicted metal-dependent peptidase